MKRIDAIKPISFLKAHTADVVRAVNESREPVIITQNGEAKAVIQDIGSYQQTKETLALLKLLAQGKSDIEEARSRPLKKVVKELQAEMGKRRS